VDAVAIAALHCNKQTAISRINSYLISFSLYHLHTASYARSINRKKKGGCYAPACEAGNARQACFYFFSCAATLS